MQTPVNQTGVNVNSKTITSIVGVIAIITSLYYFFDRVNSYELRLSRVEYTDNLRSNEIQTLTGELKTLNSKLTELTIELKEISAIQRSK